MYPESCVPPQPDKMIGRHDGYDDMIRVWRCFWSICVAALVFAFTILIFTTMPSVGLVGHTQGDGNPFQVVVPVNTRVTLAERIAEVCYSQ